MVTTPHITITKQRISSNIFYYTRCLSLTDWFKQSNQVDKSSSDRLTLEPSQPGDLALSRALIGQKIITFRYKKPVLELFLCFLTWSRYQTMLTGTTTAVFLMLPF